LKLHRDLETKVAAWKQKPAGLVFNSGYQANVGIISALVGKNDCVFSDKLNHASIIDGITLSGADHIRYRHNDYGHLAALLVKERKKYRQALIISETIFSMDGDGAHLAELSELKKQHDCLLMVDEAHATGVYGATGSGLMEEQGVNDNVDIAMGTFGKALASFGAFAAGSQLLIDYLINSCRSFIYSTALPPSVLAANLAAINLVCTESGRRKILMAQASSLRQRLVAAGFIVTGESQIVPVIIGENERTIVMAEYLRQKGFWVMPVRPPTVPDGAARLRLSLTCHHNEEILDRLYAAITSAPI